MKKVFVVLAVLSLLMVPCVSMAATMSDAELAAVTGQSGVTIDISATQIDLGLGTITYGDLDGYTGTNSMGNDFTNPGYINASFAPAWAWPIHIGISDLKLTIDMGESVTTSVAMVNIGGTTSGPITIDGFGFLLTIDGVNGAAFDYVNTGQTWGPVFDSPYWDTVYNTNTHKDLGLFCLSNISITIPTFNIAISAH